MNLRPMEYVDIKKVADFQERCFKDAWTYKQLADSYLNNKFYGFIVENEGDVIACSAIVVGYEDADLVNVLVEESFRKQGVAKSLMDAMFEKVKNLGLKELFLEVRESNLPAINLYLKYGFTKVSERKNYYKDGETAIVMKREFSYN